MEACCAYECCTRIELEGSVRGEFIGPSRPPQRGGVRLVPHHCRWQANSQSQAALRFPKAELPLALDSMNGHSTQGQMLALSSPASDLTSSQLLFPPKTLPPSVFHKTEHFYAPLLSRTLPSVFSSLPFSGVLFM